MAQGLTSVFEVGANELSRDECIAMLADGTGLSEEAVAEVRKEAVQAMAGQNQRHVQEHRT